MDKGKEKVGIVADGVGGVILVIDNVATKLEARDAVHVARQILLHAQMEVKQSGENVGPIPDAVYTEPRRDEKTGLKADFISPGQGYTTPPVGYSREPVYDTEATTTRDATPPSV